MLINSLVNGVPGDRVSIHDRGLLYGDGVFRTLCIRAGHVKQWPLHYLKLKQDCAALGLPCPEASLLHDELLHLSVQQPDAVAKIIITRGIATRGYAPGEHPVTTRILTLAPLPRYPSDFLNPGIKLRICDLRLGHQPRLAGIKHLNRLENVLAAAECNDADIAEGVLLDIAGNVIEGTRSNLFMVRNGELTTPDLSCCGVAGVQRERVFEWAAAHSMPCRIAQFGLLELLAADEIFLVNSVIGLWPVHEIQGHHWNQHPIATQVMEWLNHATA